MDQNIRIQPPLWLPVVVALLVGGAYIAGKVVETRDNTPLTITVSGEGKVNAVPDIASLQFGVTTGRTATAEEAMAALSDTMNASIAVLKDLGIEEKDISTQNLYLNPAYDWNEGERIDRGFEATENLVVKVRDLDKVGAVLTAVAKAGANQIGGVNFTIDDPAELQAEAREEAIDDAREKAETLAKQLGKSLGDIESFNEGYAGSPVPMYMKLDREMEESMGGDAPVPVPAGEQEVTASVSITYKLK